MEVPQAAILEGPSETVQPLNSTTPQTVDVTEAETSSSSTTEHITPSSASLRTSSQPEGIVHAQWWTTNKFNLIITVILFALAIAAYVAQLNSNTSAKVANDIARKAYIEQLWKDCRDREEMRDTKTCKVMLDKTFDSLSSLLPRSLDRLAWSDGLFPEWGHAYYGGYSTYEPSAVFDRLRDTFLTQKVFVLLVLAHMILLFPLRDLFYTIHQRTRRAPLQEHKTNDLSDPPTAPRATILEYTLAAIIIMAWSTAICIAVVAFKSGVTGNLACAYVLILLLSSMIVFEPAMQRLRLQAFPPADYPLSAVAMRHPKRVSVIELVGSMVLSVFRKLNIKPRKQD